VVSRRNVQSVRIIVFVVFRRSGKFEQVAKVN